MDGFRSLAQILSTSAGERVTPGGTREDSSGLNKNDIYSDISLTIKQNHYKTFQVNLWLKRNGIIFINLITSYFLSIYLHANYLYPYGIEFSGC